MGIPYKNTVPICLLEITQHKWLLCSVSYKSVEKPYDSGGKTKPAGAQALMVANLIQSNLI